MVRSPLLLLLLPLAAAACDTQPPPAPPQPVPDVLCAQAKKGLEALRAGSALDYDDKGEATVIGGAWSQMKPEERDQVVRLIAYHASCAAGRQSDAQRVSIRTEDGIEVMARTVSTRIDTREILED